MIEVRFTDNFDAVIADMEEASKRAALKMAQLGYELSQEDVPVNTGKLKRSGRVEQLKGAKARVTYGGSDAPYAAFVHEKPGVRYRHGKWKYLRDAMMEARKMEAVAAAEYRRILKGG